MISSQRDGTAQHTKRRTSIGRMNPSTDGEERYFYIYICFLIMLIFDYICSDEEEQQSRRQITQNNVRG